MSTCRSQKIASFVCIKYLYYNFYEDFKFHAHVSWDWNIEISLMEGRYQTFQITNTCVDQGGRGAGGLDPPEKSQKYRVPRERSGSVVECLT